MKRTVLFAVLALAVAFGVPGCTEPTSDDAVSRSEGEGGPSPTEEQDRDEASSPDAEKPYAWLDVELTDSVTGEPFAISDFAGQPVLVQGFAVW